MWSLDSSLSCLGAKWWYLLLSSPLCRFVGYCFLRGNQFWRYKSQTYRGPNDILWQLLLGLMPAPKGDCLNNKQIICLVHFYKRCVSGFRCDNICSFLFTGQWRPLYLDSIGCSLHLGVVCPAVGLLWTLANDLCSWIVDRPLLGWVILHSCQK